MYQHGVVGKIFTDVENFSFSLFSGRKAESVCISQVATFSEDKRWAKNGGGYKGCRVGAGAGSIKKDAGVIYESLLKRNMLFITL